MSPNFTKITPSLPVTSIPASIEYYTTILGFRIAGRDGDNHTWLQLRSTDDDDDDDDNNTDDKHRVPVNIYLRRRTFPDIPDDVQKGKVHIRVDGAEDELERLWRRFVGKGALVVEEEEGVVVKPWGLKHFTVMDHDGVSSN